MSTPLAAVHQAAAENDVRFAFGKNWQRFLTYLNEERIARAEQSLRSMLEVDDLRGLSFLDIGNGSGLFSLAAMRMGASKVHSFDYDPHSVACALELKRRYFLGAGNWTIEQGSVLDQQYLASLGRFDVVYSWGVLHHTGQMWQALENAATLVAPGGKLFIALYNDQGLASRVWKRIKWLYSRNIIFRPPIVAFFWLWFVFRGFIADLMILHRSPLARYRQYKQERGMTFWIDLLDWVGGYPFEVAAPGEVFDFFKKKGFALIQLHTVGHGHGNNEFVFKRDAGGS